MILNKVISNNKIKQNILAKYSFKLLNNYKQVIWAYFDHKRSNL
jgi:hypothetical protein